jgi:hypothetical protein
VLAVERAGYASVRATALDGRALRPVFEGGRQTGSVVDMEFHRRYLQSLVQQYGVGYREFQLGAGADGEDLPDEPPLPHGTQLTESFDKADADTLGPDQTWTETFGNARVVSNEVSFDAVSGSHARAAADLAGDDQLMALSVTALDNSTSIRSVEAGAAARFATGADTFYAAYLRRNNTVDRVELFKFVGGAATELGTKTVTHALPDEVAVRVEGSNVSALIDGVTEIGPVTDTAIPSGTRAGLFAFVNVNLSDGSAKGDGWSATDLIAVTVNAVPAGVTARSFRAGAGPAAIGTVTLSEAATGNVTLSEVVT